MLDAQLLLQPHIISYKEQTITVAELLLRPQHVPDRKHNVQNKKTNNALILKWMYVFM
jgi:hypothetical protein